MKELFRLGLTNLPQQPYAKGGDIFMATEPGEGDQPPRPISQEEANRRIDEATRIREQRGAEEGMPTAAGAGGVDGSDRKEPPAPPVGGPEEQPQDSKDEPQEEKTGGAGAGSSVRRGVIDKTGITNESLLKELDAIDALAELGKPTEDVLRESLERVVVIQEGKSPEEVEKFNKEKQIAVDRIRNKAIEIIVENNKKMKAEYRAPGLYGERKLTEDEKGQIRNAKKPEDIEKLFNKMFDRVDSRPQAEFTVAFGSIGAFEHDEFVKTLNEAITENNEKGNVGRAQELNLIVQQFANERAARETIHNAYYGVLAGLDTEKVSNFIDSFNSGWADLAFSKGGVTKAMHFYEQALLIVRETAGGYLKPAEVIGEMKKNSEGKVNELARKLLNDANASKSIKNSKGEVITLEPWQIDRALAFARGMSIITGKTIEIAASSILPSGTTAFADQYAQRIIAELAPFRHAFKFYAGSKFSRVLAYTMNRGRSPWTTKDIEDYANLKFEEQINVLNAMVPEGEERFYSVLNPLEIGGILSRTGWRIAKGEVTMINDLVSKMGVNPDEAWIGTGVQIERNRNNFVKKEKSEDPVKAAEDAKKAQEAEIKISDQLGKIAQRTPLRLFLNIRSVQEKVLNNWDSMKNMEPIMLELALLQEKAVQNQQPLDAFLDKASAQTKEFVSRIRRVWGDGGEKESFLKTLKEKEWKIPYTFGTDDVPYDQYSFETTGMRSVARRWGDMASAAKASKALNELVSSGIEHFSNQEQIVEAMRKVYDGIKGYSEDDAKKFTLKLAEGIIKFYGKDYKARLPFGIGTLMGLVTGKSSYAQIAYGRGAMAWEELQINEFTRLLRNNGMLTIEQQHELQDKAGGGKKEVVWSYARTVIPLLSLALAYYMFSKVISEKD